ncbi:hypothetical protein BUALT_Bualt11G0042800 [Buddleja alternifolia]|uniref:Uncharacterized protein n=1 Tax=Buddleja alternifolia TaxID=168488 RepID=A0AAV6WRG5_9LAMI|nr:hypothetical protein BUALT_Bualt11G0042800 [Buddleja alternifolia]
MTIPKTNLSHANAYCTSPDRTNAGSKGNDAPICPKPRRLGSALPAQFLDNPFQSSKRYHVNCDGRSGILDIISDKRMDREESGGCSSTTCGSPPGRTDNPLVHDLHFLQIHHHMDGFPRLTPT